MVKQAVTKPSTAPENTWDVIVAGGGPSGCAAAASAAREGAKVLLIEATGSLGGMGTSGLVPAWAPFTDGTRIIYRGLAKKILTKLKEARAGIENKAGWITVDPEHLKRIYDKLLEEFKVVVAFNSLFTEVQMDNDYVAAILVANKAGLCSYRARVFVDCTGDGDLAARAGAKFEKGDKQTGDLQPVNLCFVISNVNQQAISMGAVSKPSMAEVIKDVIKSGLFPLIADDFCEFKVIGPGTVSFNAGHIWGVDNTDPSSVSRALIKGRQIAAAYQGALKKFFPEAFGESILIETAGLLGIRETRRIIGDYMLTLDDYLARRKFSDEIGRNCYFIDIHRSQLDLKKEQESQFDWKDRCASYEKGQSYGIPYRCLTPKGLRNILVAGRSISCDRYVQGSIRVQPACLVTGEAAGCAAALAVKQNSIDVHKVDTDHLREMLKSHGAYLLQEE